MQKSLGFDLDTSLLLDSLGAEPLEGSGFEDEKPQPEFATPGEE